MQFGRVDLALLNDIDFKLPAEPVFNQGVLPGKPALKPAFYLGATSWNRKDWVGSVFPKGTKEKDFLEQYAKHYNSVELNATHYKIYPPDTIRKWAEKVKGRDFRFCPKVPQSISHYSNLINAKEPTMAFLEGVTAFEEHLGPIFLQVSESFSPARKDQLFNYLASLPTHLTFFVELRHPEWFINPAELYATLRQLGVGLVITDTAARRDVVHMHLPIPKIFIRYVGNGLHPTDYVRADDWVNRMHYWLENGLEEIYFFLHMHDDVSVPEMSIYLATKLEAASGLKLTKPVIHQENTLF